MKNVCYVWLLACLVASCAAPKKSEENKNEASNQEALESPVIAPITLNEAATYISNFLNHPAYGNIARTVAVGGAFNKDAFEVPAGQGGVLFWYCQNKSDAGYPEFFLALDHVVKFDTTAIPTAPAAAVKAPDYTFTYTGEKTDPDAVKHFLETLRVDNQRLNKSLSQAKAETMIQEFKTYINRIGNCKTDNCKYPLGYFDGKEGDYMNIFLAKNPTMVRYFYGYDTHYGANHIRIILIGTNDQGTNILSMTTEDGSILQKSVPPPPIQ